MKHMLRTVVCLLGTLALVAAAPLSAESNVGLSQEGVGMYTDASVGSQASTFTLNRNQVSCGVGTLSADGLVGPFEMIMYSLSVDSYVVDDEVPRTITATGVMRSTTRVAGVIVEDTDGTGANPEPHFYVAIGQDKDSPQVDRFDIHFKTPFWNTSNAMCMASDVVDGGCRFGGELFLGNVNATKSQQF